MANFPNKIKYTTSVTNNTIKAKNFVLGVNNSGAYGPTSVTNFWMGISPVFSGFTIYTNKASQGPSIFCPSNNTQLINFATYLGGTNISTVNDALAWFASQNDTICVNMDYPDIVTNGLAFNVDAGFTPSYCRSGTTWTDLSFSGFNATLINSPTFILTGNGIFNFSSSSSNYATFNDLGTLSNFSTEVWVKQNSLPSVSTSVPAFITNTYVSGNYVNYAIGYINPAQDGKIYGGFFNSGWKYNTNGFTPTTDQWYHYAVTFDGTNIIFYVDGTYYSSATTASAAITSGSGGRLMRRWDATDYIDGYLLNAKIYNRALSSTEIKQNYNAHSLPTGIITSNLVLNYDAGNILSYPGTGTVWKNMAAPTTNNGVLINGPTYSTANGGSIVFDGTNDYVTGGTGNMGLDLSNKTFQCWIKTAGLINYSIIDKDFDTGPGVYGGWGFWMNSSGKLWWWNHANKDLIDNGPLSVAFNTWTNVAVSYNNTTKSASFYYNGVLSSTRTDATIVELSSGTQPLNIGAHRAGTSFFFNGNISQVLGYNRALSAAEILNNYNASRFRYI